MQLIQFEDYFIIESRLADLEYTETKAKGEITKVSVELRGNDSGSFTRLIKEIDKLKDVVDDATSSIIEKEAKVFEKFPDYFDMQDELYNRTIDLCDWGINLSKKSTRENKTVDIDGLIADYTALVPELAEQFKELLKARTKITTVNVKPTLRIVAKEAFDLDSVVGFIRGIYSKFKSWTRSFDNKAKKIKQQIDAL